MRGPDLRAGKIGIRSYIEIRILKFGLPLYRQFDILALALAFDLHFAEASLISEYVSHVIYRVVEFGDSDDFGIGREQQVRRF
jgi:hypothetical protein